MVPDLLHELLDGDSAPEAIADAYLGTGHIDRCVKTAEAPGSRSWMPIVATTEHSLDAGR